MKKMLLEIQKYVLGIFGLRFAKAKVKSQYHDLKRRGC